MNDGPKVIDLKAAKKIKDEKNAGTGGVQKLKDDIDAIANVQDCKKVLQKLFKVLVDQ